MTNTTHERRGGELVSTCYRCGATHRLARSLAQSRDVLQAHIDKFDRGHKSCKKTKTIAALTGTVTV